MTVGLIDIFDSPSIIGIDPIDVLLTIGAHLCQQHTQHLEENFTSKRTPLPTYTPNQLPTHPHAAPQIHPSPTPYSLHTLLLNFVLPENPWKYEKTGHG